MLFTEHLDIGYESRVVQSDLTLRATEGEMICLLGRNGCGKSTLLRTIAGLQPALKGKIIIDGEDVSQLTQQQRAERMALVLTERLSVEHTTVSEVVAMGRYPYTSFLGTLRYDDKRAIDNALQQVEVSHLADRYFNSLSDGEKQRVLIAKAIAQQTGIILLDEPTAHLDLPNRIRTMLLLRQLAEQQHKTIIISTHELDLALQLTHKVWLMATDRVYVGTAEELIREDAFAHTFDDPHFRFVNRGGKLSLELL